MIAKQNKGKGFRGVLNYLLKKPEAEVIGGNMLGETPRELALEFSESRKLRPNLERAVYHASLSLAPGEKFSDEKWGEVAGHYVKEMGFEGSQYTVVRHKDTDHDHVHIVASRIRMDGSYVSDSNDYKRSEKVVRGLEIENDLKRVPNSHEVLRRAPTGDELRAALRTKKPSVRMQLQGLIDRAIEGNPSVSDFFTRLGKMGVEPIPNIAKTGHVSGISYRLDKKEVMKGSDLGRGYSWQGIQKRGVTYGKTNNVRDVEAIRRAAERGKTFDKRERHESEKLAHANSSDRDKSHLSKRQELGGVRREASAFSRSDVKTHKSYQGSAKRNEQLHRGVDREIETGVSFGRIRRAVDSVTGKEADREDVVPDVSHRDSKRPSHRLRIFELAASLDRGKSPGPRVEKFQEELRKAFELSKKHVPKNVRVDSREVDHDGPDTPNRGRGGGLGL